MTPPVNSRATTLVNTPANTNVNMSANDLVGATARTIEQRDKLCLAVQDLSIIEIRLPKALPTASRPPTNPPEVPRPGLEIGSATCARSTVVGICALLCHGLVSARYNLIRWDWFRLTCY